MKRSYLFLAILIFVSPLPAEEEIPKLLSILVGSEKSSTYTELEEGDSCTFRPSFLFRAEVVQGKIQKALIIKSKTLALSTSELEGIELYKDPHERLWFKRLSLNRRLVSWLVDAEARENIGYPCGPKTPIKTMTPEPLQFDFETEIMGVPLGAGVYTSRSNEITFKGRTLDYTNYEIKLRLIQ